MMKISGDTGEYSNELEAAYLIRDKITDEWPEIKESKEDKVSILVSTYIPAGRNSEIDLLITGSFKNPKKINARNPKILNFTTREENTKGEISHRTQKVSCYEIDI